MSILTFYWGGLIISLLRSAEKICNSDNHYSSSTLNLLQKSICLKWFSSSIMSCRVIVGFSFKYPWFQVSNADLGFRSFVNFCHGRWDIFGLLNDKRVDLGEKIRDYIDNLLQDSPAFTFGGHFEENYVMANLGRGIYWRERW